LHLQPLAYTQKGTWHHDNLSNALCARATSCMHVCTLHHCPVVKDIVDCHTCWSGMGSLLQSLTYGYRRV